MKIIENNPYRILGILVDAGAKERTSQIKRLKQYAEVEQEPPQDDYSFPVFGKLTRTTDSIAEAESKLNLDHDKMLAALFWFWSGDPITDEVTFAALKDGNKLLAMDIWTKRTYTEKVTECNVSAFQNFSTLLLLMNDYEHGIKLKINLLESDFFTDFVKQTTDKTYKITKKNLQLLFLNQIFSEIEKQKAISMEQFIAIVKELSFTAKEDFLYSLIQKRVEDIKNEIEIAKTKRKTDKENANNAGKNLYFATREELTVLKNILGTDNVKYASIADKVANEMRQCDIDYHNFFVKVNIDVSEDSVELLNMAKSIAVGCVTIQRIQEDLNKMPYSYDEVLKRKAEREQKEREQLHKEQKEQQKREQQQKEREKREQEQKEQERLQEIKSRKKIRNVFLWTLLVVAIIMIVLINR